ncbi:MULTISPECIES: hypothetical protein [unclassified Campylobacter]|uniref:hypothetical protein n=1 Tax=unclassified Campylobacter TaxID=2593542 RepID=UPI001BDB0C02|nr:MULTISPECIES: hypothetical protein [unclassified Campylobacter]MBZ7982386.1 hypothetical protein [Campylobacter sp. RM12640]MBZ7984333.1 hypothetical protein [Campylobacter sp. RM12647]MBZ7989569.1 hypothetical protein [Campylobacter sp. RM12635]MBZ7991872.1 hypothetical protein [Campylobacter sp. RM9331]MBZ7993575.1 hypothetical protein [Campylobacter sp. RM9333]MBZ8006239.1 hypothetical protein [Campylobacter sp. RM9332]
MDLITSLENTEKNLNKAGKYCVAFDLMANTRKNVSENELKNNISKNMAFILFKATPAAFFIFILFKIFN